jgi:hypothetical protein
MSVSHFLFDSQWGLRADLEETRHAIVANARIGIRSRGELRRDVRGLEDRVAELEEDIGVLALFVRTTQRLLIEKGVFSKEEFGAALRAIDLQDGKADGKYTKPVGE